MGIVVTVNHLGAYWICFCENNRSSLKLCKDIQNYIELKIKGINLRIVDGRNKGKIKKVRLEMTKKNILHDKSTRKRKSWCKHGLQTLVMTLLYHTPMLISPMSKLWYKMQFFQDPFKRQENWSIHMWKGCIIGFRYDGRSYGSLKYQFSQIQLDHSQLLLQWSLYWKKHYEKNLKQILNKISSCMEVKALLEVYQQ